MARRARTRLSLARERARIAQEPKDERAEVRAILYRVRAERGALDRAVAAVTARPETWPRFLLNVELGLAGPNPGGPRAAG